MRRNAYWFLCLENISKYNIGLIARYINVFRLSAKSNLHTAEYLNVWNSKIVQAREVCDKICKLKTF